LLLNFITQLVLRHESLLFIVEFSGFVKTVQKLHQLGFDFVLFVCRVVGICFPSEKSLRNSERKFINLIFENFTKILIYVLYIL